MAEFDPQAASNALSDEELRQRAAMARNVALPPVVQPPSTLRPVGASNTPTPQTNTNGVARVNTSPSAVPPVGSVEDLESKIQPPTAKVAREAGRHGATQVQQAAAAANAAQQAQQSPEDKDVDTARQNAEAAANKPAGIARLIPMTPMPGQDASFLSKLGHGALRAVEGIGRGVADVAEVGGNILAPGIMANIPGTQLNKDVQYQAAERRLGEAEKNRQAAATSAQDTAKANLENEQAKQLGMLGVGKSDADQLVRDMMMGGVGGTPKVNPATNQPFTLAEAMEVAHRQLKAADATPGNTPLSQQPDLFQNAKARIDQMFPNATPEQRAAFYPTEKMTPEQADKLAAQALEVSKMNSADQQRQFERQRQQREDQEKKDAKTVEWTENGKLMYGTQAEAEARNAKWIPSKKGVDDIRHDTALLNDMQAKLNDVVKNRGALDQDGTQKAIIAKILSTASGGGITIAGQHIPLAPERGGAMDQLINAGMLQNASDSTVEYIQSVLSFRESALALPKMITNSGRQSEIAAHALWATTPGLEPNSQYALGQAKKFQGNLDRLRRGTASIVGEEGNYDYPVPELQSGKAPEGYQIPLQNGHTATMKKGKWIDDTTGQEVH